MVKILLQLCFILFVLSCTSVNNADLYMLEKTDKLLCFSVSEDVKIPQISVYPFRNNGQDFLSFQNFPKSDIYIYDMNSGNFVKKVSIKTEGDNSVLGSFGGYFAVDMEHIFIPSLYVNTIFVVDTVGNVKQKINYSNTESGGMLIPFIPDSKSQMVFIGDSLYIPQTVNGMLGDKAMEESPIKVVIDTAKATITALPMKFPPLISYKDFGTVGAFGAEYSCCYDEKNFIYSFDADEDLYLTSPTHKKIEKKKAKSKYIDNVTVFRSTEGNF